MDRNTMMMVANAMSLQGLRNFVNDQDNNPTETEVMLDVFSNVLRQRETN